jgi:hypothetical protein
LPPSSKLPFDDVKEGHMVISTTVWLNGRSVSAV